MKDISDKNCESCGNPAYGYTLDSVPLCRSCGIIAESDEKSPTYGESPLEKAKKPITIKKLAQKYAKSFNN